MNPLLIIAGIVCAVISLVPSSSSAQVTSCTQDTSCAQTTSFSQVTSTANISANIVTQISISRIVNLNFGEVKSTPTAGIVILNPAEARIAKGGVLLIPGKTAETAMFTIDGQGSYTYSITLPLSALATANGVNNMIINNFKSLPSDTGHLLNSQTLNVGATLNVPSNQPKGNYTSASPFNVIVNYN